MIIKLVGNLTLILVMGKSHYIGGCYKPQKNKNFGNTSLKSLYPKRIINTSIKGSEVFIKSSSE